MQSTINGKKIHEALAYVHYWEQKKRARKELASEIARLLILTETEKGILFSALNLS